MDANELEQYKRELLAEHDAEIAAVDRLIVRERSKPNGSTPTAAGIVRHRRSAAAVVAEAVGQLTGRFTRKHVEDRIEKMYGVSTVKRASVTVELWKLSRAGKLETVKEGRGRTPATYRHAQ